MKPRSFVLRGRALGSRTHRRPRASVKSKASAFLLVLSSALAACGLGPRYQRHFLAVPSSWTESNTTRHLKSEIDEKWWLSFADEQLDALVEKALAGAPTIAEAEARVREARALHLLAGGKLGPDVGSESSYSNSHLSSHGFSQDLISGSGTGQSQGGQSAFIPGQSLDLFELGFDASWEVDLFGAKRRAVDASEARLRADEAALGGQRVALAAETARLYIELRTLDQRLALRRQSLAEQFEMRGLLEKRYRAGVSGESVLASAEAAFATNRADLSELVQRRSAALHGLEVLVGVAPGGLDVQLKPGAPIPEAPRPIASGLPSDLLLRRPDVAVAEEDLAASVAHIAVARGELFPHFSLAGAFGFQSQEAGNLLTTGSHFWYFGPGVRWPIFASGKILANIKVQKARSEAAAAVYQQTLLQAFADVETALSAITNDTANLKERTRAASAQDDTRRLAERRFAAGAIGLIDALSAKRRWLAAQSAVAVARGRVAEDSVVLIKALGGGWSRSRTGE